MKTNIHAEINVTPLVDVCLVLLIIFMVTLPMIVNGVEVQLPRTNAPDGVAARVLPLTIKDDGTVYVDTQVVRRDEVDATLQRIHTKDAGRPIAVRADKRVQYGEVASVLASCRNAGWQDISLVGEQQPR
ncbi:MAG TPA: biopolymer transporter ExbD [Thermoanaerobaculia bacterium]